MDVEESERELVARAAQAVYLEPEPWIRQLVLREAKRLTAQPGILVGALAELFWDGYAEIGIKDLAEYRYNARGRLRTHVVPALGLRDAETVSPDDIETLRDDLLAREYSAQTVVHVINTVSRMYWWGRKKHHLRRADNPADDRVVRPARYDSSRPVRPDQFYTREEVDLLLGWIDRHLPAYVALYAMAIYTGMRLGEIAGLRWRDCDVAQGRAFLRDRKNGDLVIPLNAQLRPILTTWKLKRRLLGLDGQDDLVFEAPKGGEFGNVTLDRNLHRAAKKAGVKRIRFHDLRHTAASIWAMEGVPLDDIAALLGDSVLVAQRYKHLTDEHLRRQTNRMVLKVGPGLARAQHPEHQGEPRNVGDVGVK